MSVKGFLVTIKHTAGEAVRSRKTAVGVSFQALFRKRAVSFNYYAPSLKMFSPFASFALSRLYVGVVQIYLACNNLLLIFKTVIHTVSSINATTHAGN